MADFHCSRCGTSLAASQGVIPVITTRVMACVYLYSGSDILMLHRSSSRSLHPDRWTGVGGHVEPSEIRNPMRSCLRELEEETGILPDELTDFRLRYIVLRQCASEIRQQYIFFGRCNTRRLAETDEGVLAWIPEGSVLELDLVPSTRLLLDFHFRNRSSAADIVWVGVMGAGDDNQLTAHWTPLEDSSGAI